MISEICVPLNRCNILSNMDKKFVIQNNKGVFPAWFDFAAMLLWFVAVQLAATLIAVAAGWSPMLPAAPSLAEQTAYARGMAIVYVVSMAVTIGGVAVYRRLRGARGRVAQWSARGLNPVVVLCAFVMLVATNVVAEPLTELLPVPNQNFGRGAWVLFMAVAAAPLCEEFLCRGIILEDARRKWGAAWAAVLSAAFFGIMHIQPGVVVPAFFMGLIFATVCIYTRSLFSAIALHALNNASALALRSFAGGGDATLRELLGTDTYWRVYIVSAVVVLCGVVWGVRCLAAADKPSPRAAEKAEDADSSADEAEKA